MSFAVHKLAKFSSKPGKVHFEVFIHILRYIRYNKTLGLKYYANINDAPIRHILRQNSIKTENQFMDFSYSNWKDFPDTGRITREYIIVYQSFQIDYGTHVPGLFPQSSAESGYNAACTEGMDLAHFRMLIHELLNNYPDIVPE